MFTCVAEVEVATTLVEPVETGVIGQDDSYKIFVD